ncbi:MAG: BspA family leucine-rich repeat surface protein [Eubacterium sp.]|nr:BspA family leucine-rich repeat surface protein [Eubacterium sp.]
MRKVKWSKKTLAVIMAVTTMASTLDFAGYQPVFAADTEETIGNVIEKDEETYHWTLDEAGVLTFSPKDEQNAVVPNGNADWKNVYKDDVKAVKFEQGMRVKDGNSLFINFTNLETVDLNNAVFRSEAEAGTGTIKKMFEGCSNLKTVVGLNTEYVTSMERTFLACSNLLSITENENEEAIIDLTKFDLSEVKSMWQMFSGCEKITKANLNGLKLTNLTSMSSMFSSCSKLKKISMKNVQAESLEWMESTFSGCSSLEKAEFNGAVLGKESNKKKLGMAHLFSSCSKLKTVTGLDTKNVDYMGKMFNECSELESIPLLNTKNVTDMTRMFYNCTNLKSITGGDDGILGLAQYNLESIEKMSDTFSHCTSITEVKMNDMNLPNATSMSCAFSDCTALKKADLENVKIDNPVSLYHLFYNCKELVDINWNGIDITTKSIESMLNGCAKLPIADLTDLKYTESCNFNKFIDGQELNKIVLPAAASAKMLPYVDVLKDGLWYAEDGRTSFETATALHNYYVENGAEKETYIFRPHIDQSNAKKLTVSTDTVYNGDNQAAHIIVTYKRNGIDVIAEEGKDYIITNQVLGDKVNTVTITTVAGGMFVPNESKEFGDIKLLKAEVQIVPEKTTFEYTGEPIDFKYSVLGVKQEELRGHYVDFYKDAECTQKTNAEDGASGNGRNPKNAGTYYAKANFATTNIYNGKNEIFEIKILVKSELVLDGKEEYEYTGKSIEFKGYEIFDPLTKEKVDIQPTLTYYTDSELTDAIPAPVEVGKYYVKVSVPGTENLLPVEKSTSFTIKKANVIIVYDEQTETYSGKTIPYTNYKVIGVDGNPIPEEDIAVSYVDKDSQEVSGCINAGTYGVTVTVYESKNYNRKTVETTLTIKQATPLLVITKESKPFYDGTAKKFTGYALYGVNGDKLSVKEENMDIRYYKDEACTIPAVEDDPHTRPSEFGSYYVLVKYKGVEGDNYGPSNEEKSRLVIKYEPKIVMPPAVVYYTGEKQIYPWDNSMVVIGDDKANGLTLSVGYYKEYKNMNNNVPTGPEDGAKNPKGAPSKPGTYIVKVQYHESKHYNPKAFYTTLTIKPNVNYDDTIINVNNHLAITYTLNDPANIVAEYGLVYGLESDLGEGKLINHPQDPKAEAKSGVYAYKGTENGKVSGTENLYVMSMNLLHNVAFLQEKIVVRPYEKTVKGEYFYGEQTAKSVFEVAVDIYNNSKMPTEEAHNNLYNTILSFVDPDYQVVAYNPVAPNEN